MHTFLIVILSALGYVFFSAVVWHGMDAHAESITPSRKAPYTKWLHDEFGEGMRLMVMLFGWPWALNNYIRQGVAGPDAENQTSASVTDANGRHHG